MVVSCQNGRCHVDYLQILVDDLLNRQYIEALRIRILRRIRIIHTVNVLRHKDAVCIDLNRAQHNTGIR